MAKLITSPVGKAIWAIVKTPNYKHNHEGLFSCELQWQEGSDNFAEFVEQLEEAAEEAYQNALKEFPKKKKVIKKVSPVKEVMDDEGEETGLVSIKPKRKHEIYSKKKKKTYKFFIDVFDAAGNPIPHKDIPNIGDGSEVRLSIELRPYFMQSTNEAGVSLSLQGLQIVELQEHGTASASQHGFGAQEGGYAYSEEDDTDEEESETPETPDSQEGVPEEDDF